MRIRVCSTSFNEEEMMPFYLRHYSKFAEGIHIYDDSSTDRTREIIKTCQVAKLLEWGENFRPGLNDEAMLTLWYHCMKEAQQDGIDWLILPDIDEFIWSRDLISVLKAADAVGYEVLPAQGWNMVGDGLVKDDGRQIWEQSQLGVVEHVYSKPIVVKPKSDIRWVPGRHHPAINPTRVCPVHMIRLLHYRFLGGAYTFKRSSKNHSRIAVCRDTIWDGTMDMVNYGSPKYADDITHLAVNALEDPILGV